MATITPKVSARAANALTWSAAEAGGDEFANTGKELLLVTNGAGSPVTLTVSTSQTVDGLAVADKAIPIPAGETHVLGPWNKSLYNDVDGNVQLAWSSHTDVELAVISPS